MNAVVKSHWPAALIVLGACLVGYAVAGLAGDLDSSDMREMDRLLITGGIALVVIGWLARRR